MHEVGWVIWDYIARKNTSVFESGSSLIAFYILYFCQNYKESNTEIHYVEITADKVIRFWGRQQRNQGLILPPITEAPYPPHS
jgi:hypothetical protein